MVRHHLPAKNTSPQGSSGMDAGSRIMFITIKSTETIANAFEAVGIKAAIEAHGSVVCKINLARPPETGHPRTDPTLLTHIIEYISEHNATCALAEAADGFLAENIDRIDLTNIVKQHNVRLIDLDLEDFDAVTVEDVDSVETHYIPKCLRDYAVRMAIPATSKRPGMTFSNNVKLFVGAVPRKMYQLGEPQTHRPRIHLNLHKSVATLYRAIMQYAPFHFFVNGGRYMLEERGEGEWDEILIGDDALEMDWYTLQKFHLTAPDYLRLLSLSDARSTGCAGIGCQGVLPEIPGKQETERTHQKT
jgi:hypothetical protein